MKKAFFLISILLSVCILFFIIRFSFFRSTNIKESEGKNCDTSCDVSTTQKNIYNNYDEIISKPHFIEITYQNVLEKVSKKEDFLLFYTFKTCPWCVQILPTLDEVVFEEKKEVYYVIVRDDNGVDSRNSDNQLYLDNLKLFHNFNIEKITVPAFARIEKGEVKKVHFDTVEGHNAKERYMNETEIKKLKEHILEVIYGK